MLSPVASQRGPERDRTRPAELALVDQRTVLRECERKSRLRPRKDELLRGRLQRALSWRQKRKPPVHPTRSEEHTSELQSLMRISYAVFCLKQKKKLTTTNKDTQSKK